MVSIENGDPTLEELRAARTVPLVALKARAEEALAAVNDPFTVSPEVLVRAQRAERLLEMERKRRARNVGE